MHVFHAVPIAKLKALISINESLFWLYKLLWACVFFLFSEGIKAVVKKRVQVVFLALAVNRVISCLTFAVAFRASLIWEGITSSKKNSICCVLAWSKFFCSWDTFTIFLVQLQRSQLRISYCVPRILFNYLDCTKEWKCEFLLEKDCFSFRYHCYAPLKLLSFVFIF